VIPTANSRPDDVAYGSTERVVYRADRNKIGRITTADVHRVPRADRGVPAAGSRVGSDGNIWFTEQTGSKIGRITTGGKITEFALPTPNSGPRVIATGADGNLWFAEDAGNNIAVSRLPGRSPNFRSRRRGPGPSDSRSVRTAISGSPNRVRIRLASMSPSVCEKIAPPSIPNNERSLRCAVRL